MVPGLTLALLLGLVSTSLRELLRRGPTRASVGLKWWCHSLLAGAASDARALGQRDALICQIMGLYNVMSAYPHDIGATGSALSASSVCFKRYWPPARTTSWRCIAFLDPGSANLHS